MNKTPRANRTHIGIFGMRNAGKSSLLNYITDQDSSLVSSYEGTTTDPVYKAMEIPGLGPVVFIDTAGLDDEGDLGRLRVQKSYQALDKADLALYIFSWDQDLEGDLVAYKKIKDKKIPVLSLLSKKGAYKKLLAGLRKEGLDPILFDLDSPASKDTIIARLQEEYLRISKKEVSITGDLVQAQDLVVLVMPQDIQAPKGRLILPQVQTIREILDKSAIAISTSGENLEKTLDSLKRKPDLIITDSQIFDKVYGLCPPGTKLTSFSVLFAGYKGDIDYFRQTTQDLDRLNPDSRVLILEACSHPPMDEDIGRVKIPRMLKKAYGLEKIDFARGDRIPEDLAVYDLIIHCGACMFNRAHMLSRIERAREFGVPMTNYGLTIAKLKGILDKVSY